MPEGCYDRGDHDVSWTRLDDGADEELCDLSHEAFRLYICALTYNRRRQLGGVMTSADVAHLCRAQSVKPRAVRELVNTERWAEAEQGTTAIRNFEQFNPLSSVERVRAFRKRKGNVTVTPDPEPSNAPSRASPRAGCPIPVPVPSVSNETPTPPTPRQGVRPVFDAWIESTGKAAKLTNDRSRKVAARLHEGFSIDELCDAARGWVNDPWEGRREQNDLSQLMRSAATVEKFRDLWRNPRPATVKPLTQNPNDRRIAEFGRGLNAIEGMPA